jgi:hypothetical protein
MRMKIIALVSATTLILSSLTIGVNADFTNSSSTNSSYNRAAAKSYIESYVTTPNTSYAWFGNDGGDCTNFASQVLRAGGMSFTSTSSSPTYNHWYYYNSTWGTGRTSTWTDAHYFRQHWGQVNGVGKARAYEMKIYTAGDLADNNSIWQSLYSSVKSGDIIQFVNYSNGNTYHSQIVHRTSTEEAYGKVSTAQHSTGDRDNNASNKYVNLRNYCQGLSANTWVCAIRIKQN